MDSEANLIKETYAKMASLCSRSEQCSGDIRKKIVTAGVEEDAADEMIKTLKEENYLNDERYVNAYTADKFKFNKWGKIKIRHNLRMKGLPEAVILNALDDIDEEKYKVVLIKTMKEKAKAVKKKKTRFEKMGPIIRFAQTRGFEPELIHRYMNDVLE